METVMGEIITDYFVALEQYGRPRGPFEKDRCAETFADCKEM